MIEVPQKVREAYRKLSPGWKLEKLKFFVNIRNSNVDKTISEDEQPVRLCNYTDVYYHDRITADLEFMEGSATDAEIERFQLKRGQVIITKDSEGWDDIGIPAFVTEDMPEVLCGYHLSVFEPGPELDGGFLAWLCRAEPLNDQFKVAANGVTRYGLGQYPIKNAFIALPPLDTQQRIARFLDEKTTGIDGVIEKKRELLERLAEKREALIALAVTRTRGINDQAPMKPSGIDWLGEIPAHSQAIAPAPSDRGGHHAVRRGDRRTAQGAGGIIFERSDQDQRLKWAFSSCKNGAWGTEPDGEPGVVCIRAADFDGRLGRLNNGERTLRSIDPGTYEKLALRSGDIVLEKSGGGEKQLVGRAALFDGEEPSITSNFLARCRPAPSMEPAFVNYLLLAIYNARGTFPHLKQSTGIQNLDISSFLNLQVIIPPLDTQQLIARFLDEKTARIDVTRKQILCSIENLLEYRSALITTAVTGQLAELR